jgi:hypothetical protein
MVLQHLEEALTNYSGSAKNSNANLFLGHFLGGKNQLYHVQGAFKVTGAL